MVFIFISDITPPAAWGESWMMINHTLGSMRDEFNCYTCMIIFLVFVVKRRFIGWNIRLDFRERESSL